MAARARILLIARRVAWVGLTVTLILTALALAVHLPWVESRATSWAAARLEASGIRMRTRSLTYNLATRHVHVEQLVVSTTADSQHPFFEAASLDLTLPRSIWTGALGLESLDARGVRVVLLRRQDGSTNYPSQKENTSNPLASFPIGALTLPNVSVTWRDDVIGAGVSADALSVRLDPVAGRARGRVALDHPAKLRIGDRDTTVAAAAQLTWDGARVSLESMQLEAPEGTVQTVGSIGVFGANPSLSLDATGQASVSLLSKWATASTQAAGRVAFRARATGPVADPSADITLTSDDLGWQHLTGVAVNATAHVDQHVFTIDPERLVVRALGGTVTGSGRLSLSDSGPNSGEPSRAVLQWRNVDPARLLAALGEKLPVTIETTVEGHATASWTAQRLNALTADLSATTSAPDAGTPAASTRRGLGLAGTITLGVRAGNWQSTIDETIGRAVHLTGRTDGRLTAASLSSSTVTGAVSAAADSMTDLWNVLRDLDLVGTTPPSTLTGHARADVTLSGRIGNPELGGQITAEMPALDELRASLPDGLRLSGGASVAATLSGTVQAPALDGHLSGQSLSAAGQHADHLEATWKLTPQALRLGSLELTQPDGRMTATGQYDLRTRQVAAQITATHVKIEEVPGTKPDEVLVPVSARLNGEWRATGTFTNPQGLGQLELTDTAAYGRDVGHIATRLTLADKRLGASIDLADLFTTGTATLALAAPGAFVVDTRTTDADLAGLAARMHAVTTAPVTGTASFTAHVEGTTADVAHARGSVDIQRLVGAVGEIPVRSTGPGQVSFDGRTLDVGAVALEVGRNQIRAAGRLGPSLPGTLTASLDGEVRDLEQVALVFLPADNALAGWPITGRVHVDVRAAGSLDRPAPIATATLDDARIGRPDQPQATLVAGASYDAGMLTLSRLESSWQSATLSATGDIPLALVAPDAPAWLGGGAPSSAPGRLRARFDSITPAVLAPFVPETTLAKLGGLVSGTLTLDASRPALAAVRGQLMLDQVKLLVAGVPFDQEQPTQVEVADGRAKVVTWDWGGAGNRVVVGGDVAFDGNVALDLSANGTIDLRALGAFLPQMTTAGTARLQARVTGAPADPQVSGRLDLQDGEVRVTSPRMVITDLTGGLVFTKDDVTVSDVKGEANGGSLLVTGMVTHSGASLSQGRLAITGRGLAMAIPDGLKSQVNLGLALAVDRGALTLSGDATVLGGAYRQPISIATGLLGVLQSAPVDVQLDTASTIDAMELDVHLTTADDITVDNNYGQLALAADLHIGGTVAQPSIIGRTEIREGGRIFLGGNVYQIVGSGVIAFSNAERIEPDVRLTAVTRVTGIEVTMTLKGTPTTLETTLTSDASPPLTQGEIVSLLVTGQAQSSSALAISNDQLLGYLSGEVLGATGRALGLDTLRIGRTEDVRFDAGLVAGETDPSSRLTFGKQVTRNVEVVFSQSLKDSGKLTWILGYRPRPNIELRAVSQDNEARIYDFRHDVTIGGRAAPAAVNRGITPKVASVSFTGTPGVAEPELRRTLRLTPGKSFDFFRWQQDRDRLEDALRADSHFEARVSTRRSDAAADPGATVDLTYIVARGPHTVVDVSGLPRSRALESELQRLWGQAVFDGFLLEEAKSATRAVLIRDGYLQAAVTTSIDRVTMPANPGVAAPGAAEQEKRLHVSVQPGPHFASRRVVFTGQEHIGTDRLDMLARDPDPALTPWIDPAPLVRNVIALYHNEGYLDAKVTAGAPLFDVNAGTATLPIAIAEGALFHVDAVVFAGAHARTDEALTRSFPLKPGAVLTRAAADDAVQTLASSYRADGFNAVRVTSSTQANRASGRVDVTVTIEEGPRQVLRAIAVEGAHRTSPGLVTRELHFELGQPVNLAAWAQARKRLYDTGVFRQVDIQAVPIDADAAATSSSGEQPIRARVTLEEWPPLRVRYGVEVDEDLEPAAERTWRPGVAADTTYRNVFGRAASTGVALRYTKDFEAARTFFTTPSFLGLPLVSNLFLARSREHFGADTTLPYIVDKATFTAEQRFRKGRRLQIAYSYSFEHSRTFDAHLDPDNPFATDKTNNIARLTATAVVDTRDDLIDATRGVLTSSTFEQSIPALGSDLQFTKYFFQQNYYRTLRHGVVFATSGRVGLAAAYGQDLIPSEHFFAGGGNSVRGFGEGTLGPTDPVFGPAGGNALVVFNEEVRFPIAWRVRGVGFLDAGNAFATVGDLRLTDLRAGTGVGLRVQTPFALLRFDLGTPLARRPGEPRTRWFVSIGQSF